MSERLQVSMDLTPRAHPNSSDPECRGKRANAAVHANRPLAEAKAACIRAGLVVDGETADTIHAICRLRTGQNGLSSFQPCGSLTVSKAR